MEVDMAVSVCVLYFTRSAIRDRGVCNVARNSIRQNSSRNYHLAACEIHTANRAGLGTEYSSLSAQFSTWKLHRNS